VIVTLAAFAAYALTLRLTFPAAWAEIVMLARRVLPSPPSVPRPRRRPVEVSP